MMPQEGFFVISAKKNPLGFFDIILMTDNPSNRILIAIGADAF